MPATSQVYNYDLMGRVTNNQQAVGDQSYSLSYGYNLGAALTSETYPSGRVVSYAFDSAARLSQVSSGSTVYANQFDYSSPQGLLKSLTLGNGAVESYDYNSRLQLKSIDLAKTGTVLQHYDYKYGVFDPNTNSLDETKNNGQIARIEGTIGTQKQWQQNFTYDSIGRLSSAREFRGDNPNPSGQSYLINYDYDLFGNRKQKQANNSGNPFAQIWTEDADIDQTTNRIANSVTYDNAGNVQTDQKYRQLKFQYDANNRQKQSSNLDDTAVVKSVYDAAGQRVATQIAGSLTNVLVYDAMGELVAEYGSSSTPNGTQYVMGDHQGSTRAVMKGSGTSGELIVSRHDYLPFGGDIYAGVGMRAGGQGYNVGDSVRQKYAGMETDDATGMAHTLWRNYDSSSGRWTAPDPYGGSMTVADPQSFNRYNYVSNDPVNQIDPTGLMLSDIGILQTDNPAEASYEEKNATWHTLRNASRVGSQPSSNRNQFAGPSAKAMTRHASGSLGGLQTSSGFSPFAGQSVVYRDELAQVKKAFQIMREVLLSNNVCSQFFGPSGIMALDALESVTGVGPVNDSVTDQPSPNIGISTFLSASTTTNQITQGTIENPTYMTVNSVGIFFNPRDLVSAAGIIQSNTPEGQAIQIAHEMSHVAHRDGRALIVYDGPRFGALGPVLSRMSTARIMSICLPAIRSVLAK